MTLERFCSVKGDKNTDREERVQGEQLKGGARTKIGKRKSATKKQAIGKGGK